MFFRFWIEAGDSSAGRRPHVGRCLFLFASRRDIEVKNALRAILAAVFLIFSGAAAEAEGIVLVLSGGGTRGFAHIGVIEVLEEQGIPVAGIVGTSIGALIGALNASGYNAGALREMAKTLDLPALLSENTGPLFVFTGDDREAKMNTISALTYKKMGAHSGPLGILTGDKLFQYYTQLTRRVDVTDFNELPIPYAAVATDLQTGEKVVLRSGSLPSAMRASMSIPALFEPWEIDGRLLIDGGVVSNMPIDTAKELFPGVPVVGVDVSDIPTKEHAIRSFLEVIDQSLTIVMRRATLEEARNADCVVTPRVQEFSFLDGGAADEIIARGREAALENIGKIRALSNLAPGRPAREAPSAKSRIVSDVVIHGLPESVAARLRKQFLRWVGKPLDTESVENAVKGMMDAPDIATVDYMLQRTKEDTVILVLDVRPRADLELGLSGYTTNLDPYRWLYLKGTARGLFSETDSLRGIVRLGKQWGVDLSYLTAPEPLPSWEFTLAAQKWEMSTSGGYRKWNRFSGGSQRLFQAGKVRMGLGLAYEYIDGERYSDFLGPAFFAAHDTLDIPGDPTKGQAWRLNVWWPDMGEILYRFTYFKPVSIGKMWRVYLRFGYAEGNLEEDGHASYLGSAEELYSIASRPVEAERMAWINIAFRRVLKKTVLGIVAADLFGSYGYAMDEEYRKTAAPWEVGLAFSVPNNLVNVKLAAMYGSEEFKIGFFLGVPLWEHYPLP
jgi:NTE family protein